MGDIDRLLDDVVARAERRGLEAIATDESSGGAAQRWPPPHNPSGEPSEELTEEDCAYVVENVHRIYRRIAERVEQYVDDASYSFEEGWALQRREDARNRSGEGGRGDDSRHASDDWRRDRPGEPRS